MTALACLEKAKWMSWEDKIAYLAWKLKPVELKLIPIEHRFEDGWYVRTMRLPADAVFVGRPHRHGHIIKLIEGRVGVMGPDGEGYHEAPDQMVSTPGYQMVLVTRTVVVGETWHPNPEELRDVQVLEDSIFEPAAPVLARGERIASKIDYEEGLKTLGLTEEAVQLQMQQSYAGGVSDEGQENITVADSPRQGMGCFALVPFRRGQSIAIARGLDDRGTLISRYTNHSVDPNARLMGLVFVALRPIAKGEEITVNYREVLRLVA